MEKFVVKREFFVVETLVHLHNSQEELKYIQSKPSKQRTPFERRIVENNGKSPFFANIAYPIEMLQSSTVKGKSNVTTKD